MLSKLALKERFVLINLCACVCVFLYVCTNMLACLSLFVCAYMGICMCVCVCVCVPTSDKGL